MRFSLRTLIEAVFLVAVLLAIWGIYYPRNISKGDLVEIGVIGTMPDQPINRIYRVQETGDLTLGPPYGTVPIEGLSGVAASNAITKQLKTILSHPEVSVRRIRADAELFQLQLALSGLILLALLGKFAWMSANRKLQEDNSQLRQRLSAQQAEGKKPLASYRGLTVFRKRNAGDERWSSRTSKSFAAVQDHATAMTTTPAPPRRR